MRRLRIRIVTLLLLIVIAALGVQRERAAPREAELQGRLVES